MVRDVVLVGSLVLLSALFGIFTRPTGLLATFWPANALLLGLMVRNRALSRPVCWVSAALMFMVADLSTGSRLATSLWLTAGNLVEVAAGLWFFSKLDDADRRLTRPHSVLSLLLVCSGIGLVAGALGFVIEPLAFGRDALAGARSWMASELANYMVVLPVVLTAPSWAGWNPLFSRLKELAATAVSPRAAPACALLASLGASLLVPGEGVALLGLSLLALLWCALRYDTFSVSLFALLFGTWTLMAVSGGWLVLGVTPYPAGDMASLRVGLMLAVMAQIAVASTMSSLTRAKETAEGASVAMAQFLAVMSHELRTPMTGIMGLGDLLLRDARLPDDVRDQLGLMRTSTQSLLTLVNDVLDHSKLDAGKLELEAIDFAPGTLLQEVAALLQPIAASRNNRMLVETSGLPSFVRGDPTRLRQVLYNLLGNALKFTRDGTVEVTCLADEQNDQVTLRFMIRDTGIGMTEEQCARLFQAYGQADASTARMFGGTGLGLSISKRLIEAMGGTIEVESKPGVGSVFGFSAKLTRSVAPTRTADLAATTTEPFKRTHARVLVADDDPITRFIIISMLQRLEHQVTGVENGLQALEAVAAGEFDVVLLDMFMPELDGMSTASELRKRIPQTHRLTIIGLSAGEPGFTAEHAAAGLDAYLTKPIHWAELKRAIETTR